MTVQQYIFDYILLPPPVTLTAPTVSGRDASMWTITSPDGSRVDRYIVEFECRVRNITFVEKAMSVSASGGTGRVATNVSCFGGLGQLYRVKVWAVSGPNISPALVCIPDGQCSEEEDGRDSRMHSSQRHMYIRIRFIQMSTHLFILYLYMYILYMYCVHICT